VQIAGTAASGTALASLVSGDTFDRVRVLNDGTIEMGSGTAARDTNLYRSAANTLKTDDALVVTGAITGSAGATITGALTQGGTNLPYQVVQVGSATVSMSSVTQQDATVTFPQAFSAAPIVICSKQNSPTGSSHVVCNATGITTTGFTMRFNTADGSSTSTTNLTGGYIATPAS
jgi:hypothetical protein